MTDLGALVNVLTRREDVRDSAEAQAALFAIAEAILLFKKVNTKPKGERRRR